MEKLTNKIKTLVQRGKEKGFLTYEELNDILPDDTLMQPEKIDEILMMLDELGIDLIEETEIETRDMVETEKGGPHKVEGRFEEVEVWKLVLSRSALAE